MKTENALLSRITKPYLLSRVFNKILSFAYLNQWTVLLARNTGYRALNWKDFTVITSPADRFWADPFIWFVDDRYYLFVEEFLYSTNRGRIACLALDDKLKVISNQVVLERPYHLSYPFLFNYEGKLFMIPETGENNSIELYQCIKFPYEWEFKRTLIKNIHAVDTTILYHQEKWWMFTNVKSNEGSTHDTLHLYYGDNPISDNWIPHKANPIVKDISRARPAGRIFFEDGLLIRPSQDCLRRYGYAINFNKVTHLNEVDYKEAEELKFQPPTHWKILATHTYNKNQGLTAIDALLRRRKNK